MQLKPAEAARRVLAQDDADPEVWKALRTGSDHNGQSYYLLLSAMGRRNTLRNVPALLTTVIEEDAWRHWRWIGQEFTAKSFGEYVTRAPPKGLGATLEIVAKLIADDPEALAKFRKLTTRANHRPTRDESGNNIPTYRPHRGTSRAWILDRLERDHPDLFAEVVAKDLSANKAAIKAGFRKPTLTVSADDPDAAVAALIRRFGATAVWVAIKRWASAA